MPAQELWPLSAGSGTVTLDTATGAIHDVELAGRHFVVGGSNRSGLLRLAAPLENFPSHYLELGTHGAPRVVHTDDGLRLSYRTLSSKFQTLDVLTHLDLRSSVDGLVIRARIENHSDFTIPQVAFPQLLGLESVGGTRGTRLQLSRRRIEPFTELTMRPDDAKWLSRWLQTHIPYGVNDFTMKWMDYGDTRSGLTLYSRNTRYTTQGLVLDRQDRATERLDLRWLHYPFIEPGEIWDSDDYVMLLHDGDWFAGARAYQTFAQDAYPYHAPQRIREALAIRSVWPAVRNAPPTFTFDQLPRYAAELADPELGIGEMVLWHWWLKNGLPIIIDERLGTREDLEAALAECARLGVAVSAFVSHNLVRVTDETDPEWRHVNAAGQTVEGNYTYGPGFLPLFRVPFMGTHAMVQATPLSRSWRESALAEYETILDYGATSICFDVFCTTEDPEFNPAADGRRDEAGEKLIELGLRAREMIHARDPEGTFSGEYPGDVKVPVLDYSWEWKNAFDIAAAAPFRYVFPHFRLNANVGTHPRGALIGFMEGALLNLIPGDMRSHPLADHPDLVSMVRRMAALRRRFLPFFTQGQFRSTEGLTVNGGDARSYSLHDDVVIIAINPTDEHVVVSVSVDPTIWGGSSAPRTATIYDIDGALTQATRQTATGTTFEAELGPDDLCVVELLAQHDR